MGSVWRAEHLSWEAPVAIKLMNRDIADQPEARARFEREVRLAAGLRSPHVVQVLDHGVDEATRIPFIAMELLEGESLDHRLKRLGRLGPSETFGVVSQIVRALSRAHEAGIVHRDLKPENIFLVRNEEDVLAKVLDFGIAKGTHRLSLGLTRPGRILGTPYYMSPEQFRGSQEIDQRSDLWSLSVISCECLTGRRPFEANDFGELALLLLGGAPRPLPSELAPVPPAFDAWFLRATHADLAQRFQSARELGQALAAVCGVTPNRASGEDGAKGLLPTETDGVSAGPLRWHDPALHPHAARRPLIARLVVASAVALLTAAAVVGLRYRQGPPLAANVEPRPAAAPVTQAALPLTPPPAPAAASDAPAPAPVVEPSPTPPSRGEPALGADGEQDAKAERPAGEPPRPRSKTKSTHPRAAVKTAKASRPAAPPPAAPPSEDSDARVDVNGRRIRMTLEPSP